MLGPSKRYWVSGMTASVKRRLSESGRQLLAVAGAASATAGSATPAVAAALSSAVARRKLRRAAPACMASP